MVTLYLNRIFTPFVLLVKSLDERLEIALLNTIIGIATVFVVLALIIFIIRQFKFLPILQEKLSPSKTNGNTNTVDNVIAKIVEQEEEELVDNYELVAVITAALYASLDNEMIPTDGLIVRSIRKVKTVKR